MSNILIRSVIYKKKKSTAYGDNMVNGQLVQLGQLLRRVMRVLGHAQDMKLSMQPMVVLHVMERQPRPKIASP